jgi:hypothetical protein
MLIGYRRSLTVEQFAGFEEQDGHVTDTVFWHALL